MRRGHPSRKFYVPPGFQDRSRELESSPGFQDRSLEVQWNNRAELNALVAAIRTWQEQVAEEEEARQVGSYEVMVDYDVLLDLYLSRDPERVSMAYVLARLGEYSLNELTLAS